MTQPGVSEVQVRVNYSEVDAMGVAYHARYLVWLDIARTDHLRQAGMTYKEMESAGYRLVVSDLRIRYRQPAQYDDPLRLKCWVRDVASRRVAFGYAIEHADDGRLLATAYTDLLVLDSGMNVARLPESVARLLHPIPDPVRL